MNIPRLDKESKPTRLFATFCAALTGGLIFSLILVPLPWLLGPMTAVMIASRFVKIKLFWPTKIRDTGLVMVGYSIGLSFTKESLILIVQKLPSMLMMTILLVVFCAGIAFVVSKLSGIDYPTILTGSIPGGLSQMIVFAEEMKGIDITTVTFLQVARLLMIIFVVPFLVFSPLFGGSNLSSSSGLTEIPDSSGNFFPVIILFAVISIICGVAGKKLKLPTPYLLGPIIGIAAFNISGIQGPALPPSLLEISQFMIGCHVGLLLKPEKLKHKAKIISLALMSGLVMIAGSILLSLLLIQQYDISSATSFLSLAPGGMDQMGIMAHEVGADLSMVTSYQLFRILFIYFAIPPMLRWFFRIRMRKNRTKWNLIQTEKNRDTSA